MFFENLGLLTTFAVAGAASLITVALYLLDRSRRRLVVSTLRFWQPAMRPVESSRKRRIQQPWSMLLQIVGSVLLVLAIAQPKLGSPLARPAYHVLILETSAWMGAQVKGETLMEKARRRAMAWLRTVPQNDRVMVVRADAMPLPVTSFETTRAVVTDAIDRSVPGSTTLDIAGALAFARHAQALRGGAGSIVFVGSGRTDAESMRAVVNLPNLRVIPIAESIENAGLRRASMHRAASDPDLWEIALVVHNYGPGARELTVGASFNQAPIGARSITLEAGADREVRFSYRSRAAGIFEAHLDPEDSFAGDDRVTLQAPALPRPHVVLYTARAEVLRPFLAASDRVDAEVRTPEQYRADEHALVILDRFAPRERPTGPTVWIDPPPANSPIPVAKQVVNPKGLRWNANHPVGVGLRASEANFGTVSIFRLPEGAVAVSETDDGPALVAANRMVVLGFDPAAAALRYRLAIPLLFANILRWMQPDAFRNVEVSAGPAASVGDTRWEPPATALRGVPRGVAFVERPASELWPWLAVLGAGCWLAEWMLSRRTSRARLHAVARREPFRRAS